MATLTFDNLRAKLTGLSDRDQTAIRTAYTGFAEGYMHRPVYKFTDWDGRVTAIGPDFEFDTGLVPNIIELMKGDLEIVDRRPIRQIELVNPTVEWRDYQFDAIKQSFQNVMNEIWWPRGILNVATGGGKTETAVAMVQMARVRTLFLCDQRDLVEQARARFAKYGIETGTIAGGEIVGNPEVVVATVQGLMAWNSKVNRTTKKKGTRSTEELERLRARKAEMAAEILTYLETVEMIILDEAHMIGEDKKKSGQGNFLHRAMMCMPNAYMRFGLTGTPFMRDACSNWLLEGAIGRELHTVTSRELIEAERLADPEIVLHQGPRMGIPTDCGFHMEYMLGVEAADWRNEKIVDLIATEPGPTLVLVNTLSHGMTIQRMAAERGLAVEFMHGKTPIKRRTEVWQALREERIQAVVACRIADKGLDVESIRTLINAGGGKSMWQLIQRLGRALRRTATKTTVRVHDFLDRATPRLTRQANKRRTTYHQQGHKVTELQCAS